MTQKPEEFQRPRLDRQSFPWDRFDRACREGLSAVRPLRTRDLEDAYGWNFGTAVPPSYWAYGRMRALLAIEETLALPGKTLVELAAGDAALCAVAAEAGRKVVANDLRAALLAQQVRNYRNHEDIRVVGGNLFDLDPKVVGRFDILVACEVVEHVAHTVDFLAQCRRFLKPGGHALITTPNGEFFRNQLPTWADIDDFKALEANQFKPDADGHLFLLTPAEMAALGRRAGFELHRLTVWGSPFLTGNAGFGRFSSRAFAPLWNLGERCVQRLPSALRSRLCTAISVVYRNP